MVVFFILSSYNVLSATNTATTSGTIKIMDPNSDEVASQTCTGASFSCELTYKQCDVVGQYYAEFSSDGDTTSEPTYYCSCIDNANQCVNNKFQTCNTGVWTDSGIDTDNDGVDQECEDNTCDNSPGICNTAVNGKCSAKTTQETSCFDSLDNDCDTQVDCSNDLDCEGIAENTRGCWNRQVVLTGSAVQEDIMFINGVFYGCSITDQVILDKVDINNQPIIQNQGHCFQDSAKYYFCSFNNKWEITQGVDKSHPTTVISEVNPTPQIESECCAQSQCWDGNECVNNQRNDPNSPAINNFRCIDGSWSDSEIKLSPTREDTGYCPVQDQCLVNPNNPPDEQCVENDIYFEDNYCESGIWTSRTKYLALQMIELTQTNDFILFCDTPQSALNRLNYIQGGQLVESIVTGGDTNYFCVLESNNKKYIGTSLNKPIAQSTDVLSLFDANNCDSALTDDGQYHSCDGLQSSNTWYNQKLKSIIYSKQEFAIGQTDFITAAINFIKNPFDAIKTKVSATIQAPYDTSYLDSINRFDKLYISKKGAKEIRGTVDGLSFKNLVVEYKNFNTDICSFITEFNRKNLDGNSGIECNKDANTYTVLAQGSTFTTIDPGTIWNDLTSKLRIN